MLLLLLQECVLKHFLYLLLPNHLLCLLLDLLLLLLINHLVRWVLTLSTAILIGRLDDVEVHRVLRSLLVKRDLLPL